MGKLSTLFIAVLMALGLTLQACREAPETPPPHTSDPTLKEPTQTDRPTVLEHTPPSDPLETQPETQQPGPTEGNATGGG
jgi:hypothetical protein